MSEHTKEELVELAESAIASGDFGQAARLTVALASTLAEDDVDPAPLTAVAQVLATLEVARQQRIANKLAIAQIDQLTFMAQAMPGPGYPRDPSIRIRDYLTGDEWAVLDQ